MHSVTDRQTDRQTDDMMMPISSAINYSIGLCSCSKRGTIFASKIENAPEYIPGGPKK